MSEPTIQNNKESTQKNSNHIAGCGIFLVILAMVIFLASVTIYSYYDIKNAFVEISQETAVPTKISPTTDTRAITALDEKFFTFSALVKDNKHANMTLTIDELNLAIAHFKNLSEFKETFYVTAITDKHIEARSSLKVNAGFDGIRHFNGLLKLNPVIAQGSIFPIIDEAIPDTGAKVPPKILQALPVLMFVEYRNDESIKDVFHKLTKVELIDETLRISSDPSSTAIAIIDMDVTNETTVGLQLFGLITFIFVTTIAFALWYTKYKQKQKPAA